MKTPISLELSPDALSGDEIAERLRLLGITLPEPPKPVGSYSAVMIRNGIGAVSGQFPLVNSKLFHPGVVGFHISEADGYAAARAAALNVISQIETALGGFQRFGGLLRLEGYVASAQDFLAQPHVLDGASELFVSVFGQSLGSHSRTAFSVTQLPLGASVELAVTFAVTND
ncbi:RidA family protein [Pseudomonas moraviensis]|jgi:enamine deaminase RidA (YjgF/YER057c/UK114 family)|uniref:RidA family protein n=1 Tax=Pseudomonas TaxID=286 RepID=UPI00135EE41B|nr:MULTISPECIES: RidA family protein [Pseudomonas]MXI45796.1 RidA family protein [Pseudomonas moraviensis]WLG62448.1 RidA family protein [Pseudomonas sp. FP1762]